MLQPAPASSNEVTFMDIADMLYEARTWMAAGLGLGLIAAAAYFFAAPATPPQRSVELQVYSTGSPSYSGREIFDQLSRKLTQEGFSVTVDPNTYIVKAAISDGADEAKISAAVDELERAVDEQAKKGESLLKSQLGSNNSSPMNLLLSHEAYLQGRANGFIDLVSTRTVKTTAASSRFAPAVMMIVAGVLVGLALSMLFRFSQRWRDRRRHRSSV